MVQSPGASDAVMLRSRATAPGLTEEGKKVGPQRRQATARAGADVAGADCLGVAVEVHRGHCLCPQPWSAGLTQREQENEHPALSPLLPPAHPLVHLI